MKKLVLTRRQFIGFTLGTVIGSAALAQLQPTPSESGLINRSKPFLAEQELVIPSSPGLAGHRHEISIPLEVFSQPVSEVLEFSSSTTAFHRHTIHLTPDQIHSIAAGGVVTVPDSQWGEHSFEIYIPQES